MKKSYFIFLFLMFAISAFGQTYSKQLKKNAKSGDIAAQRDLGICYLYGNGIDIDYNQAYEWLMKASVNNNGNAQYHLGVMCEKGYIVDVKKYASFMISEASAAVYREIGGKASSDKNCVGLIFELAYRNGSNDAAKKLYEYYKKPDMPEKAMKWLKILSDSGEKDFQYEYALALLNQGNETEAKLLFKKAMEKGQLQAQRQYELILQKEKELADAESKRIAFETARLDSIAIVEADQRRKQDSIDIAQGRKLPSINYLISKCFEYNEITTREAMFGEPKMDRQSNADMMWKFSALCSNDQLRFFKKNDLDELDKARYKKSPEFILDKKEFDKARKSSYAILVDLKNCSMRFQENGFTIKEYINYLSHDNPIYPQYLKIEEFFFPTKPQLWIKEDKRYKFPCSDIDKLVQIRSSASDMALLMIFTPLMTCEIGLKYSVASPVNLYLVNKATGEVFLDLSSCVRKTTLQTEKVIVSRGIKHRKAELEKSKPKKHSTPKQVRCIFCGGKGYYDKSHVVGPSTRERCEHCYGKGYTMEYYY